MNNPSDLKDLAACRAEIDRIDSELIRLFCERMQVCDRVACCKRAMNTPIEDPERERALLQRVSELAGEEMETYTQTLYQTILSLSKEYQAQSTDKAHSECGARLLAKDTL